MMTTISPIINKKLMSLVAIEPLVISSKATAKQAIAMMGKAASSYVLVIEDLDKYDEKQTLVGILTERDVVRLSMQSHNLDQLSIQEVMSHPVITIQISIVDNIKATLNLFRQYHIRHLPLLDGDRLIGMLTQESLTELLAETVLQLDGVNQLEPVIKGDDGYSRLASAIPVAIFRLDQVFNCTYVNDFWSQMTGRSKASALGHGWMDALHPDDRDQLMALWSQNFTGATLDNQIIKHSEGRHLQPDGRINWFHVQIVQEFDADNNVIGYIASLIDISDRKQSELLLQNLSARLELALQSAQIGIWEWDIVNNGLIWDDRMYTLYGVKPADFSGAYDAWINGMHPEDLPLALEASRLALTGEKEYNTEFRVVLTDGRLRTLKAYAIVQRNEQGEPLKMIGINYDITDLKQVEMALQQELLRRDTIFNTSSDGIHILDIEGNLIEFNDKFAQMLGYTSTEIANLNVADWDAQWTSEEFCEIIKKNILNDKVFETLHRRKDGLIFPVEISRRLMEWQGEFALVCISRDISDRKKAELALQESQHFIQKIADSSPNILYLYDIQKQQNIYSNREVFSILGYLPDELKELGDSFALKLMHPDDLREVYPGYCDKIRMAQDGEIIENEYRMKHVNGEWHWLYSRDSVFSRDENGLVKRIIGTAQDITARKHLEQSQKRLIAILEASTDYISMSDAKGNIFWKNAELKRLCGIDPHKEDVLQFRLVNCHPQWAVELIEQQAIPSAIANGSWLGETALLDAEGREILVSQLLLVHKSPQGEIEFFSNIMRDMRVYKEYEQQLERTNANLIRATSLKDEFLASMSHELRTPLNAILGMAEGLQDGVFGNVNERQLKALQTIERSGAHLLELINDILDVSKIESGQMNLDYGFTNVEVLCQSSIAFVKQQALQKNIQIDERLSPNLPDLWVDERRIRQVLINLLNNAVKFTAKGGRIILEVTHLSLNPDTPDASAKNFLRISIIDTGIGIAPENIHKLFQPFVQIDSALNRKFTGTGLGLSLVKRVVELHGGKVGLRSELGVGSCFMIDLPYVSASSQPDAAIDVTLSNAPLDDAIANPTDNLVAPLVLLAEDNDANIATISSYLSAKGYRVILAKNGLEAIALAKSHQPDLILMDIQMPIMDGIEAIKQIRLDPDLVGIPIIALTALAMTGDHEKCLSAGANDYLTKPVKLKQLMKTIQQLLG